MITMMAALLSCFWADDVDLFAMDLEDLLKIEISVASKSDEQLIDAPSSVTVFTADEIEKLGVFYLENLLNYVPGYQATRDVAQGNGYRVAARGFGEVTSGSHLFLVDGIRLNDLYTGNGLYANRFISLANIKQVEIIRGPGSALYGSNAFVGVINIRTRDDARNGWIQAGGDGLYQAGANFSRDFEDIKISAFVNMLSDKGQEMEVASDLFGQSGQTRDPFKGMDFHGKVSYGKMNMVLRHSERSIREYLIFGGLDEDRNAEDYQQDAILLEYNSNLSERLSINYQATYNQHEIDQLALLIPRGLEIAPDFSLDNDFFGGPYIKSHMAGAGIDAGYRISDRNNLSFGVLYEKHGWNPINNLTHDGVTLDYFGELRALDQPGNNFTDSEADRSILGVYLQDKMKLGNRADLTLGVRFDDYSDFGNTFNPRAALIYRINEQSRLKAMYGSAFRAPNFLELYDRNNPVDFGNPNLAPETIETYELSYVLARPFNLNITVFQNRVKDLIVLGEPQEHADNPLFAPTFYNGPEAETSGLETELRFFPGKGFGVRFTWTHMLSIEQGLDFPENSGSLSLNWSKDRFRANLNAWYRQEVEGFAFQDSYLITNLACSYQLREGLRFTGTLANLFDEHYLSTSDPMPVGLPNRGLEWRMGLVFNPK